VVEIRQQIDVEVRRCVRHTEIIQGTCVDCGAETTGTVPADRKFGYGPFLTAIACHLTGMVPATRRAVLDVFRSVFDVPIELGTTQKLVDRGSEAIVPHYDAIEVLVHQAPVNFIDETSQYLCHDLVWLWVMGLDLRPGHLRRTMMFNGLLSRLPSTRGKSRSSSIEGKDGLG
jgi:hypothetical protein